ncbi:MAG: 4-alpha-glucanotransferase [Paludibacteraceae bacterium]|nr:4-alpha-glucanotransferase [Paludibacteraceae bacterium]
MKRERKSSTIRIRLKASPALRLFLRLNPEYNLTVMGAQEALGNWTDADPGRMEERDGNWELTKKRGELTFPLEYKYVLQNRHTQELLWQKGWNLLCAEEQDGIEDTDVSFDGVMPRVAGVAVPVFSLRSDQSSGVGEFEDLKEMVDLSYRAGMHIIQTLPVNDTWMTGGKSDTYPYNPLCVFSLNPLYLRLQPLAVRLTELEREQMEKQRLLLNALPSFDYEKVLDYKINWLRRIYERERTVIGRRKAYRDFLKRSEHWIWSYAVFCVMRDRSGTSRFTDWHHPLQTWSEDGVRAFADDEKNRHEVGFYCYLQYCADAQLRSVHAYAQDRGVLLKGDLPIGVSPCGVDVWMHPTLFNRSMSAGAPPDYFSEKGQNWGFPTYNWDEMSKDGYAWWCARLQNMSQYFDAYRIDHVLGFFRIWSVPRTERWGLLGQFDKALPLSKSEIEQSGLKIDERRMLEPYVTADMVERAFGERSETILATYFEQGVEGTLRFRKEYASQEAVIKEFRERTVSPTEEDKRDQETLLRMRTSVLFVRDYRNEDRYHPRIAIEKNASYEALDESGKTAYAALYFDYFYHRHDRFWRDEAMRKLPPLLEATGMLACGEDLGMIPSCVSEVMHTLQILSLEIQTMPKQEGREFDDLRHVPYETVASPTTHDMAPLRLWWEEDASRSGRYYNHVLHQSGDAPKEMSGEMVKRVLEDFLNSPSMIVIAPIQDWMGVSEELRRKDPSEERINVPDNADNVWDYRMHVTAEQLMNDERYIETLRSMIKGREENRERKE